MYVCKLNLTTPYKDSFGLFLSFKKGEYYDYIVETHPETLILVYKVSVEKYIDLPIVQSKFDMLFDNIEKIREDKLNIILN